MQKTSSEHCGTFLSALCFSLLHMLKLQSIISNFLPPQITDLWVLLENIFYKHSELDRKAALHVLKVLMITHKGFWETIWERLLCSIKDCRNGDRWLDWTFYILESRPQFILCLINSEVLLCSLGLISTLVHRTGADGHNRIYLYLGVSPTVFNSVCLIYE